jgi:predicted GIY-YIG superfamily endonuclease
MAIDECQYSFKELAEQRLPALMEAMKEALSNPLLMSQFAAYKVGKKTILKDLKKKSDFQGCYVLSDKNGPLYVGISRGVVQRLIQHVKGKTHFDASFAYRIASENYEHEMSRGDAMNHDVFKTYFSDAQIYIADMSVAFIEISNDLELYLFEVYCSMELDTSLWNTFRTH